MGKTTNRMYGSGGIGPPLGAYTINEKTGIEERSQSEKNDASTILPKGSRIRN